MYTCIHTVISHHPPDICRYNNTKYGEETELNTKQHCFLLLLLFLSTHHYVSHYYDIEGVDSAVHLIYKLYTFFIHLFFHALHFLFIFLLHFHVVLFLYSRHTIINIYIYISNTHCAIYIYEQHIAAT